MTKEEQIKELEAKIKKLNDGMKKARENNCASQSEFYAPALYFAQKELDELRGVDSE